MPFFYPCPRQAASLCSLPFGRSWHSHIPFGSLFNFQGTVRRSFTCSHWEEQNYRVFLKNFLFYKRSLHSFGQRGSKCTPILRLSKKNFYSVKISPHLFGITKPNDTLFYRKKEKIFFRLWVLCFAYFEKSLSLIPTERSQMHTLNLKKFIPSLIWN